MLKAMSPYFLRLACISLFATTFLQTTPQAHAEGSNVLPASWHGFWTSPSGYLYEANMHLSVAADNSVTGDIHWTLRKSPHPEERVKLGLTGVEHVSGTWLPDSGVVRVEGISLDDPNHILGVDKYRLLLSDDAKVLGGFTWNHGPWTGQILLHRK
jgi:hypothetical protein